jgi:P27 family predicted phage terminase small subunit
MPGPPRVPTHLKLLRRNPGHQRLNRNEPVPAQPPAVPEPPAFLTGYAADEWYRVSAELHHLKLLTILDVMPLATYCTAYQRWRTAEEVLGKMAEKDPATSALLVRGPDGAPRQNPMVKIAAQCGRRHDHLCRSLWDDRARAGTHQCRSGFRAAAGWRKVRRFDRVTQENAPHRGEKMRAP